MASARDWLCRQRQCLSRFPSDLSQFPSDAQAIKQNVPVLPVMRRRESLLHSPALGRNVALDLEELLFESIQTGLDRLPLCDVGSQHSI
ncbi:MAG: hypothetical protein JW395_2730 [Nitrospira sp.]|nr:hypothetical protein [Nitrospira sp.]